MPLTDQGTVNSYIGNGVTTVFAYGFKIFQDADLTVLVDGAERTLITDYTVTGAGSAGGGTVVFGVAPANGSKVVIYSDLTYDRSTDYQESGDLLAETLDLDIDRVVRLIQQLRHDKSRSIKVPIDETTDMVLVENAATRANTVLGFDATGKPVAKGITDLSTLLTAIGAGLQLISGTLSVKAPVLQGVAGGTADAITAVLTPALGGLTNNLRVLIEATAANATTTPTFAPDGLIAKTIIRPDGAALLVGDIKGAGYWMDLLFDASRDKWILLNPARLRLPYAVGDGAADAYTATFDLPFTEYYAGMEVFVKIPVANLTTAPVINLNPGVLGSVLIQRKNSVAVYPGDMPINYTAHLLHNGSSFDLLNPYIVNTENIKDAAITAAKIAADAITTAKVLDEAITSLKLAMPYPGIYDDFICGNLNAWAYTTGATLAAASDNGIMSVVTDGTGTYFGVSSSATSNNSAPYRLSTGTTITFEARVKYTQQDVVFNARIGLANTYDGGGNGFMGFDSLGDANKHWWTRTKTAGNATSTDSTIVVSAGNLYQTLKLVATSASVLFYINGVLVATHTTNIPTENLCVLAVFQCNSVRNFTVDYVRCYINQRV